MVRVKVRVRVRPRHERLGGGGGDGLRRHVEHAQLVGHELGWARLRVSG